MPARSFHVFAVRFGFLSAMWAMAILLQSSLASPATAQDANDGEVTLTIGSKAPSLDIQHWVSDRDGAFEKVTNFEDGKVYVVEFWATWCGPCIGSMPHLAETQDEYADQDVQIISVTDEDLDTVNEFLENTVQGEDELTYGELTSKYSLTADPDGSTSREYMKAAGQTGIPTCFIVGKTGLIEWTGHPMSVDKPLAKVVGDQWDREAFKENLKKRQKQEAARLLAMKKLGQQMLQIDQDLQAGKNDAAIKKLNELVDDEQFAAMKQRLIMIRSQVAVKIEGQTAIEAFDAGVEEFKDYAPALNHIAWAAVQASQHGESVSDDMLTAALAAAERAHQLIPKDAGILDTIAHIHHLQGNLDKAIQAQEEAVANSGDIADQFEPFLVQLKAEKAAQESE